MFLLDLKNYGNYSFIFFQKFNSISIYTRTFSEFLIFWNLFHEPGNDSKI